MKLTELERAVIERMLIDRKLSPTRSDIELDSIEVSSRDFSGVGFLTELVPSEQLKVFGSDVSLRWGDVGARLNAAKVETLRSQPVSARARPSTTARLAASHHRSAAARRSPSRRA